MGLKEYHRKRDFRVTSEPKGHEARKAGWSYVIQKHDASHLHYDFRLEFEGVLKSWAVPKGPSLDPAVKRLAMHVEDHPVDYGGFEGIIPEGEYGGGTVMLWDRGTWEPVGDPAEGLREGRLKFILHGEKLQGAWMLVRKGGSKTPDERAWFLFKERDKLARPRGKDILVEKPKSVATGRDLDAIAAERDRVWNSNGKAHDTKKASPNSKPKKRAKAKRAGFKLGRVAGAVKHGMPRKIEPELCTLTKDAPAGDEWLHEIKFDGYRILTRLQHGKVELFSRRAQSWTDRLPHVVEALSELPVKEAILDGEIVALEPSGKTSFQSLQSAFKEGRSGDLVYSVFDLLYVDGHDLRPLPLVERKEILHRLLGDDQTGTLRYVEHLDGDGPDCFQQACKLGLEGIISKRRDRPYIAGRGYDWLKIKCVQREEFVIGGYTEPGGSRHGFGALLIGYYDPKSKKLLYAGKVGTGYSQQILGDLMKRFKPIEQKESPFENLKRRVGPVRTAHWLKPKLVAQIEFSEWTRDNLLRHPSFQGLREDKLAAEVTRDRALPVETAVEASEEEAPMKSAAKTKSTAKTPSSKSQGKLPTKLEAMLTHPEKVLYPEQGETKRDLAAYYFAVAERMLPHLEDRPLVLVRCPEGEGKECFYQKHPGMGTPKALRRVPIKEKTKSEEYVIADDVESLVSLAQIGALEIHVWGSRADRLEQPDRLIFDLDPDPTVAWPRVVESAQQIREFLGELGLTTFVKTTGGKGVHIVAPLRRHAEWPEVREFAEEVADAIAAADPERYTTNMLKKKRTGKIFLDYLRNARGATAVAPYSTRAKRRATVSVPITWDELPKTKPDQYTIESLPARLAKLKRDPWQGFFDVKQTITAAMRKQLQNSRL